VPGLPPQLFLAMAWFADSEWEQMRSGSNCPMCVDSCLPTNPYSDLVAELSVSYVRLQLGTEMLVGRLPGECSNLQAPAPKVR